MLSSIQSAVILMEVRVRYDFLLETYATERIKVLSVWSEFRDTDLEVRSQTSSLTH